MGVGVAPASAKKARTPAQYASPGLALSLILNIKQDWKMVRFTDEYLSP